MSNNNNPTGISRLLLVVVLSGLVACDNPFRDCLRGNGIPGEEKRDLTGQSFRGIVSEGDFDVTVVLDSTLEVEIEADENLIEYIRTQVSGDVLIIDQGSRNCIQSDTPIQILVHTPCLNLINLTGSGIISCDNLVSDNLSIVLTGSGIIDMRNLVAGTISALITGSGDIILWGVSNKSDLDITGSGNIRAMNLESNTCDASISGSGNIECNVNKILNAYIPGSGTISYIGLASVYANITGSGSVVNLNP